MFRADFWILTPVIFLSIVGTVVLSSIAPQEVASHIVHLLVGLTLFFLVSKIDLKILKEISPILFTVTVFLLLATLIVGTVAKGASRWIGFGDFIFQPAEIAKPVFILFFARLLTQTNTIKKVLLLAGTALLSLSLIYFQPDLGSTLLVAAGIFGVLFVGGVPLYIFAVGVGVVGVFLPVLWNILADYQKQRIISFTAPGNDPLGGSYNSIQATIAVGSGGLFGRGLGQGTQSQLAFLPERHTDFIFASLSEELGLLASLAVIIAFAAILLRVLYILKSQNETFERAILGGIFFLFLIEVVVNIGMNLNLLPVAGVPLPFVSAGGSAIVSLAITLGIAAAAAKSLKINSTLRILG